MRIHHRIVDLLASCGYSGWSPVAPGTCGTAVALLVAILVLMFGTLTSLLAAAIALGSSIIGVYVSEQALQLQLYGEGRKDPGQVVIDEFAGYFWSLVLVPPSAMYLVLAFFIFRAFDILKPFPISWLERLPGGWGIMLDDIAAGMLTALVLFVAHKVIQ